MTPTWNPLPLPPPPPNPSTFLLSRRKIMTGIWSSSYNGAEKRPILQFEDVDYRRKKRLPCLSKNILCESCCKRNFETIISDFCPFGTKFNMYWERTALNEIVARNCSEVDPELGGRKMFWYSSSKHCYFVIDTQHKFNSQDLIINSPLKLPRVTLWISYILSLCKPDTKLN